MSSGPSLAQYSLLNTKESLNGELLNAIKDHRIARIQNCIERGADVNCKVQSGADRGMSALHKAALHGLVDVARILLSTGADINIVNADGYTPLHTACYCGKVEMAEYLLSQGGFPRGYPPQGAWVEYTRTLESAVVSESIRTRLTALFEAAHKRYLKGGTSVLGERKRSGVEETVRRARRLERKAVNHWEIDDVVWWVTHVVDMPHVVDAMRNHRVDGWMLLVLTMDDLIDMKIPTIGERHHLYHYIRELQKEVGALATLSDWRRRVVFAEQPMSDTFAGAWLAALALTHLVPKFERAHILTRAQCAALTNMQLLDMGIESAVVRRRILRGVNMLHGAQQHYFGSDLRDHMRDVVAVSAVADKKAEVRHVQLAKRYEPDYAHLYRNDVELLRAFSDMDGMVRIGEAYDDDHIVLIEAGAYVDAEHLIRDGRVLRPRDNAEWPPEVLTPRAFVSNFIDTVLEVNRRGHLVLFTVPEHLELSTRGHWVIRHCARWAPHDTPYSVWPRMHGVLRYITPEMMKAHLACAEMQSTAAAESTETAAATETPLLQDTIPLNDAAQSWMIGVFLYEFITNTHYPHDHLSVDMLVHQLTADETDVPLAWQATVGEDVRTIVGHLMSRNVEERWSMHRLCTEVMEDGRTGRDVLLDGLDAMAERCFEE